jgi:hypothetical protein
MRQLILVHRSVLILHQPDYTAEDPERLVPLSEPSSDGKMVVTAEKVEAAGLGGFREPECDFVEVLNTRMRKARETARDRERRSSFGFYGDASSLDICMMKGCS